MAINQTHKQSELEKRLKLLRTQMYGKTESYSVKSDNQLTNHPASTQSLRGSDMLYLRADLTKISILALLAFGIQFMLFFLIKNNFLSIKIL